MSGAERKRVGRRPFYRRPIGLVALGLASCLGAASAFAATGIMSGHTTSVAARSLSVRVQPSTRTIAPGDSARFSVRVARRYTARLRLSGNTDLRVSRRGLPAGAAISFSPEHGRAFANPADRTTVLTVLTAVGTPAGTYLLRVHAQRPHRQGSAAIRLVVSDGTAANPPAPTPAPQPPLRTPDAFTISGALTQVLTPGIGGPLDLTLTNEEGTDISITGLSVSVAGVTAPRADATHPCTSADFSVEQFSGAPGFTLPASSTVSLAELGFAPEEWPRVSMDSLAVNQDGCKQASLRLAFSGTAVEVTP